jgi:hypothetical protein
VRLIPFACAPEEIRSCNMPLFLYYSGLMLFSTILPNSLQLVCRDDSRRYFGDYLLVRVRLSLAIPLELRFFRDEDERRAAQLLLPDPTVYRRSAERMGVASADAERVQTALVDGLLRNSAQYLGSEQFPLRYIQAEMIKARSGKVRNGDLSVFRSA